MPRTSNAGPTVKVSSPLNGGTLTSVSGQETVADIATHLGLTPNGMSVTITPQGKPSVEATLNDTVSEGDLIVFQQDKHTSG